MCDISFENAKGHGMGGGGGGGGRAVNITHVYAEAAVQRVL